MADASTTKGPSTTSRGPAIFRWLAMAIFALHASTHIIGAGDTWVALACGRHIFNHGVSTSDPFSANSYRPGPTTQDIEAWPQPAQWLAETVGLETVRTWHPTGWINQNWLTHLLFYWLAHESPLADAETYSFNSLVYWKMVVSFLTVVLVYYAGVQLGVSRNLSAGFACLAIFVSRTFLDIRPAGFSNLLTAAMLLILAASVYRSIRYIWLLVPLAVFWCNVHGGYIYLFMALVPFVLWHALPRLPQAFVPLGWRGLGHTIAAGVVAILATVMFNPYHLANLTHGFAISLSGDAARWRSKAAYEWRPAFEWNNPVGDERPFVILFVLACAALIFWGLVLANTSRRATPRQGATAESERLMRIDPALILIAALTIYMALRARRFIPMAAVVACPIVAALISQSIRMLRDLRDERQGDRAPGNAFFASLRSLGLPSALIFTLCFGAWCGLKYKRVYLDRWPFDPRYNSVFMRMTQTFIQPIDACRFIRDNQVQGNLLNEWTEGGFIAYAQTPDVETGQMPLQVFIDGRAQQAYPIEVFDLWSELIPAHSERRQQNRAPPVDAGEAMQKRLNEKQVWVALVPIRPSHLPFVQLMDQNPRWRVAYFDDQHIMFVDITTSRGERLFRAALSKEASFPNDHSAGMTLAHNLFFFARSPADRIQALEFASEAFRAKPSFATLQVVLRGDQYPELKSRVDAICRDYFDRFVQQKEMWVKQEDYYQRLLAAQMSGTHLQETANRRNDKRLATFYNTKLDEYVRERNRMLSAANW